MEPGPGQPETPDALLTGPVRGRGAGLNPGNRFDGLRLHVLGEHLDEQAREHPGGAKIATQITYDQTREIINRVDVPDLPFHWTINPYRGCEHGCIYCYARPGHEYLGLSCGVDFETRIHAKARAAELLREALGRRGWTGDPIVMSGVTDPYQPVERDLRITRACLEVMRECGQAVSLLTKNHMITRDIDVLAPMAERGTVRAYVSLTTLDNDLAHAMEPRASAPQARLRAIHELHAAGIPVGVMTAPIIPGLTDHEIPRLLEAARDAGAQWAGMVMLRLPHQVSGLFLDWLARHFPERAGKVESLIRQCRGGELNDPRLGSRMTGEGPIAEQIRRTFRVFRKRFDLEAELPALETRWFHPPREKGQLGLFDQAG